MSKPFFHSSILHVLDSFRASLPHAVLLSGKKGIGLTTAAYFVSDKLTVEQVIEPQLLTKTSSIPQISVEMIRELYESTRTKHGEGRVIIIKNVDAMTPAAQHAFLKLLEEPNESTHFILTSHSPDRLLPTIRSRTQHLHVPAVDLHQTEELLDEAPGLTEQKRQQLLFIANGLPAELYRLLNDEDYFEASVARMRLAKQLLSKSSYETIRAIITSSLPRQEALALIESMISILETKSEIEAIERMKSLMDAYEVIENGVNIKLQLARAMV